ncbi:LacI family transcriptional regulator [Georgenia sp. TF02-10]|uniref:LacI family DNA-binding transcriptional regulator n=1 Tax=Georgenia sp. TF02-10 TaxID=2917725 RepID=UPI001FA7032F|nr:LacI family DNA-binding transcriptional regulator [Georgenia sp. TF02-10]UNX56276.1 LacI family transcriptional regulator [Georgenia sp. TF02-10]
MADRPTSAAPARRPTIRDIAAAARVSRSTASRALSGQGYVAQAARLRVEEAAQTLGYVPDATARHLRRRVSDSIGVVLSDLTNCFYAELAAGASQQARRRSYTMVLSDTAGLAADEVESARAFVGLRVAGVITTPVSAEAGAYLRGQHVPTVEVDRQFAEGVADAVVVDNTAGASRVTRQLVEIGHRRIALFIDETRWTTGRDRYQGYADALATADVGLDPSLVVTSGWDVRAARAAAVRLLADPRRPTAVFAANNVLAEGVWRAAADLGLAVPADLSLVSFDDAPWMSMVSPGITAVAQDVRTLGETAVDVLLDRLAQPDAPARTVVVPAEVVLRGSTAPPAG